MDSARAFYLDVRKHLLAQERAITKAFNERDREQVQFILDELERFTMRVESSEERLKDGLGREHLSVCQPLSDQLTILAISFKNVLVGIEGWRGNHACIRNTWVADYDKRMRECEVKLSLKPSERVFPISPFCQ